MRIRGPGEVFAAVCQECAFLDVGVDERSFSRRASRHRHKVEIVRYVPAASTATEDPARPLTGAELAAKHGFEPIPDWKRDPVARPMQSAASGDASKEET